MVEMAIVRPPIAMSLKPPELRFSRLSDRHPIIHNEILGRRYDWREGASGTKLRP